MCKTTVKLQNSCVRQFKISKDLRWNWNKFKQIMIKTKKCKILLTRFNPELQEENLTIVQVGNVNFSTPLKEEWIYIYIYQKSNDSFPWRTTR